LDAYEFQRSRFTPIIFFFQAQLDCFPGALHESVEVLCLRVATSQARDCRDVVARFVAFDDDREFARILHKAILARRRKSFVDWAELCSVARSRGAVPTLAYSPNFSKNKQIDSIPR
jgi:hypothetical protein